jgi:hypothetical protein
MTAELTLYRCYWPQVFRYLREFQISNFKAEAFGMLMTLDINPAQAEKIAAMLPFGAVVDLLELESADLLDLREIDDLLLGRSSARAVESDKN